MERQRRTGKPALKKTAVRPDFRSGKLNKTMGHFWMRKNSVRQDDLFFFFTDFWSELNSWTAPEREERNRVKLKMKQNSVPWGRAGAWFGKHDHHENNPCWTRVQDTCFLTARSCQCWHSCSMLHLQDSLGERRPHWQVRFEGCSGFPLIPIYPWTYSMLISKAWFLLPTCIRCCSLLNFVPIS